MPQVEAMDAQTARTLADQETFIHATAIELENQPTQQETP
jgi:hypothetical protein